ncbi:hypothetical protein F5887DRAFT_1074820 [Amanita rubescens]|nr:hypothetical protein F5887DRAFT_1082124 [Amanita rubescens]KAF8344893.1 hypothetical protein F5887DRAFT_1074820 [Amanita rubescens]
MSNRRSTRTHRAPLNPEQGTMPLVNRRVRLNTSAEEAIENPPPSQTNPPDTEPSAPAPTANEFAVIDEPVSAEGFSNNALNKLLHDAAEMNCRFDSQQAEGIHETDAPSPPSSHINEGPRSTSSEGSDRLETPATNVDGPTTEGGESEEAVIAIGLHRTTGEVEEVIMSMKVRSVPRVDKVVARAKREDDSSTQNLRRMLEMVTSQRVLVATAKKLVRVHQVADLQGKWGDGFKVLGKLEDVEKSKLLLQPCDPCPEAVDIQTAANASPSSPIFVMYFIEQDEPMSVNRHIPSGYTRLGSSSLEHSGVQTKALESTPAGSSSTRGNEQVDPSIYLKVAIDEEYIRIYEQHVVEERGTLGAAFPIIIFARLVKQACDSLQIPYTTGSTQAKKYRVSHEQWVSMDDIILFFRGQINSGGLTSGPALSTFANHRSWHLRAENCIKKLGDQNRDLSRTHQNSLDLVKMILRTPLKKLGEVERDLYGSFNEFQRRVKELENVFRRTEGVRDGE